MANLKGGNFSKQIRDANFRLEARGEKKGSDHKTHSNATFEKREMYMNDFAKYAEENNLDGKLNQLMTPDNIDNFLNQRLEGLANMTIENYISGFNSLLNALEEQNITIPKDDYDLTEKWHVIKETLAPTQTELRGVENPEQVINGLYEIKFESGLMAELQLNLGYRVSEAEKIVNNPDKYITQSNGGILKLVGVIGKGGKEYVPKEINTDLANKLNSSGKITQSTYQRHLSNYNISSHDFRFQYARNLYEKLEPDNGVHSLKMVSQQLNHNREEITNYYLSKTQ